MKLKPYRNIDEYITQFPAEVQELLHQIRAAIHKAAPHATETIKYGIPTFDLHGNLVHFAGYEHHVGFYPGASGIKQFAAELSKYESGKGSVQFPIDEVMPLKVITKIVKYRVSENIEKALAKKDGFLLLIPAPARRALESNGINSLAKLSKYTATELLKLHGVGKSSIPILQAALEEKGLSFKS